MSRYNKVDSLSLPPGHCFSCRTSTSPAGFVDLGFSDDWLGAFYLCEPCVSEMARLFGMKSANEVAEADQSLVNLREYVDRREAELLKLHAVRDAIRAFREDGFDESGVGPVGDPAVGKSRGRPRRAPQPPGESATGQAGEAPE